MHDEFDKMVYQVHDLLCDAKKWNHISKSTENEKMKMFAEEMSEELHEKYKEAHDLLMKMYNN
jgi:hypothetical protein